MLDRIKSAYGPLAEPVKCSLCGTPHQKGFVVEFHDAAGSPLKRGLLGHNCGEKEFGATWTNAVVTHNKELRAEKIRDLFEGFLLAADEVEPKLESLLPGLVARKAVRKELLIGAPDFMRRCQEGCRDHQGQINPYDRGGPKHILAGQLFFMQDNATDRAKFLLDSISNARRLAEDLSLELGEIAVRLGRFPNLKTELGEIEKEAASGRMALQTENLKRAIAANNWLSGEVRIKLDGHHLFVWRTIGIPAWLKITDLRRLPV